jgi:CubicO group peptidase (beta-lactamase class C family)
MTKFLQDLVIRHDLHDIDLVVFRHGSIVMEETLTHPDVTKPMAKDNLYRVASISKLVVAIAVMRQVEQGTLCLDDDISDHVGFLVRHKGKPDVPITIRMLLTHTSGLQDTNTLGVPPGESLSELFLPTGRYHDDAMYRADGAGVSYHYYNTGFSLLATMVERLTKRRFDQYVQETILRPLGMHGGFDPVEDDIRHLIHPLYRKEQGHWVAQVDDPPRRIVLEDHPIGINASVHAPQGGLRSNARELAKLMSFWMSGDDRILRKATLAEMNRIHVAHPATTLVSGDFFRHNGLGVNVIERSFVNRPIPDMDYDLVGHSGIAYGLLGIWFLDPVNHNGVIFLSTGHGKPLSSYAGRHSQYFSLWEDVFQMADAIWRT